jgi:hypothetical protein
MSLYRCWLHILAPPYILIHCITQINLCKGIDWWRDVMATCLNRNILIGVKIDECILLTLEINICSLGVGKRVWFTVSTVPPRSGVPTAASTATTLARTNYGATTATTTSSRACPTRAATNNSRVTRRLNSSRPYVSWCRSCSRQCFVLRERTT